MEKEFIELMRNQEVKLEELLILLKVQQDMIMKKDTFGLEGLVDKLNECSKIIAKEEVARRKFLGEYSLVDIINKCNNEELKHVYEKLRNTLNEIILQKETNSLLLKQELIFTNKMLNVINPDREIKTYNSFGGLRK
ncbi:flagellar export chaperone FlgN [Clostridium butyricum]|uniref:flagellar export chaperone FlgN n=1 Tax=Clostridium butyricum TaxID=1492 RepID=UPI0034654208